MKIPGPVVTINIGLVLVILLSVYLIWTMIKYMKTREGYEGVYAPAEFFRMANGEPPKRAMGMMGKGMMGKGKGRGRGRESYVDDEEEEEEAYAELEDVDETYASWGDGSRIQGDMPTFSPLLVESAQVQDDSNALFSTL